MIKSGSRSRPSRGLSVNEREAAVPPGMGRESADSDSLVEAVPKPGGAGTETTVLMSGSWQRVLSGGWLVSLILLSTLRVKQVLKVSWRQESDTPTVIFRAVFTTLHFCWRTLFTRICAIYIWSVNQRAIHYDIMYVGSSKGIQFSSRPNTHPLLQVYLFLILFAKKKCLLVSRFWDMSHLMRIQVFLTYSLTHQTQMFLLSCYVIWSQAPFYCTFLFLCVLGFVSSTRPTVWARLLYLHRPACVGVTVAPLVRRRSTARVDCPREKEKEPLSGFPGIPKWNSGVNRCSNEKPRRILE